MREPSPARACGDESVLTERPQVLPWLVRLRVHACGTACRFANDGSSAIVVIRVWGGLPTAVIDLSATRGGIAVALPWDCRGTAVGLPWDCRGIAVGLPWDCRGIAVALLWLCCGFAVVSVIAPFASVPRSRFGLRAGGLDARQASSIKEVLCLTRHRLGQRETVAGA